MAAIHIFTYDWIPASNEIASGGGLRGRQLVEALRETGHDVTFSVPSDCRHVQRLGRGHKSLRTMYLHDADNQADILREVRPEVVIWTPFGRGIPPPAPFDIVHVYDMIGLPHFEAAFGVKTQIGRNRERLVRLCQGIDLLLTGSEEQNGYYLSMLTGGDADPFTTIVPYALPLSLAPTGTFRASKLRRLHVTGMIYPWSTAVAPMRDAAEWVARRTGVTLSIIAGTDPGGATDRSVMRALEAIGSYPNVELRGEQTFAAAMGDYGPGSIALDTYEPNVERRLAVPIRTVNALMHGVPVVTTIDSTFTRQIEAAGAGFVVEEFASDGLARTLDHVAALPAKELEQMGQSAKDFAAGRFNSVSISRALDRSIRAALEHKASIRRGWQSPTPAVKPLDHVLVLTDAGSNLTDLRVQIPFGAMYGRGLIGGYSVWHGGGFVFSTSSNPGNLAFDAIWVQREIGAEAVVALRTLERPFVYDIDDNLLVSPLYRPSFTIEFQQMARYLLYTCAVLSCSTARLARELQRSTLSAVIEKAIVTPNLARNASAVSPSGRPRSVVWTSSDSLPLTKSAMPVMHAIRDFCVNHEARLVCIGNPPHDLFVEADLKVQHVGPVSYGAYLSLLQSFAPSIMVCPLETEADPLTQLFVNSKSDIKMLEVIAGGLVGVFSRAIPYQDSDLPEAIMTDNTYAGWYEAMTRAWAACEQERPPIGLPEARCAATRGVSPWFEALHRARLPSPLPARALGDAVKIIRGRHARRLLPEAEFDEAFYMETYTDVSAAIERGDVSSAYAHYQKYGFVEYRRGRPGEVVGPHDNQLWANLLQTIGDLKGSLAMRREHTERLKARRAARISLRRDVS